MATRYRIFLVVAPGLEELAADELRAASGTRADVRSGGVECAGGLDLLLTCVTGLRIPDGVRVRVARFDAHNFDQLREGLARIPWHAWLSGPDAEVRVTARKSALYHTDAVADRVREVLAERVRPSDDGGDPAKVFVRIERDRCVVSVDAAGDSLHLRGWPKEVAAAGLRETLAAGALRAAGFVGGPQTAPPSVVWDPFCGAGTLGLEWLAAAYGQSPMGPRSYALESWPSLRDHLPDREPPTDAEHELAGGALDGRASNDPSRRVAPRFIGSDRDAGVVESARRNIALRGFEPSAELHAGDVRAAAEFVPEGAAVITNLPYGKRLAAARPAMAAFGDMLRARPDLGPVWALDGSGRLAAATGLPWKAKVRFQNRGLAVTLARLERRR